MPKYAFKCDACGVQFVKITPYELRKYCDCPSCGNVAKVLPSMPQKLVVDEKLDTYRNKSTKRNINEVMKKRTEDHVKKHEVGELVSRWGKERLRKTSYGKDIK